MTGGPSFGQEDDKRPAGPDPSAISEGLVLRLWESPLFLGCSDLQVLGFELSSSHISGIVLVVEFVCMSRNCVFLPV